MPKSERNEGKWTELEPILCTSGQEGGTRRWHQRVMRAPKIGNARARGGVDAGYTPGRDCGNSPAPRLPGYRVGQDLGGIEGNYWVVIAPSGWRPNSWVWQVDLIAIWMELEKWGNSRLT
ncbi:hypothetical protein BJ912DRAFT_920629 [Pholiota molesta]|nr:hypothetical protein BJ912DRAFT_920629 [Pholiota molesta]